MFSLIFSKDNRLGKATMVSLLSLVSTKSFHIIIFRSLDQRGTIQHFYSVMQFIEFTQLL